MVGPQTELLGEREEPAAARTAMDAAIAEVEAMTRRLRQAAADDLPAPMVPAAFAVLG